MVFVSHSLRYVEFDQLWQSRLATGDWRKLYNDMSVCSHLSTNAQTLHTVPHKRHCVPHEMCHTGRGPSQLYTFHWERERARDRGRHCDPHVYIHIHATHAGSMMHRGLPTPLYNVHVHVYPCGIQPTTTCTCTCKI